MLARYSAILLWKIGSGALSDKMLLVRIVENNEIYGYLSQVRKSKGYFCPAGLGKGLKKDPAGLEPPWRV